MYLSRFTIPRFFLLNELSHYVKGWTVSMDRPLLIFFALIGKKNLRVLMADDDSDDRELFETAIRDIAPDVEVKTCKNGLELMRLLNDQTLVLPDIIFLDLNMPFKNGQECLEEIRKTQRLRALPIIIYSTSANKEYVDQTYSQGADYYFTKPDSYKELKTIATRLFALDWGTHTRPTKEQYLLNADRQNRR